MAPKVNKRPAAAAPVKLNALKKARPAASSSSSAQQSMKLQVLLLNCEDDALYGKPLPEMLQSWLGPLGCTVDSVCVKESGALPDKVKLQAYDGVIVGGSHSSAYDTSQPWIEPLSALLRSVAADATLPHLLGICFGHQILAQALGGKVQRNLQHGYQIGAREWRLNTSLLNIFECGCKDSVRVLVSHGDVVTTLPPGAVLVGAPSTVASASVCKHESFLAADRRVLTFQCHPEFGSSEIGRNSYGKDIDAVASAGLVSRHAVATARGDIGSTIRDSQWLAHVVVAHFRAWHKGIDA